MSHLQDHEAAERTLRLLRALHRHGDRPVSATQLQEDTALDGDDAGALGRETVRRRLLILAKAEVCCRNEDGRWTLGPETRLGHAAVSQAVATVCDATGLSAFAHEPSVLRGARICVAAQLTENYLAMLADHLPRLLRRLAKDAPDDGTPVRNPADLLADTHLATTDAPGAVILSDPARRDAAGAWACAQASVPTWRVLSVPLRAASGSPLAGALSVSGPDEVVDARQEELLAVLHQAAQPAVRHALTQAA